MAKYIGLIGFGIVGQGYYRFLERYGRQYFGDDELHVAIWDQKMIIPPAGICAYVPGDLSLATFIEQHDILLVSPGIDMTDHQQYAYKFLGELDIFAKKFKGSTFAVTGSLGKTTVVSILGDLLKMQACEREAIMVGGNIGIAMLDLLAEQETSLHNTAVLELSSFQLESSHAFAPDVAVITNCYPNHLDRHRTMAAYADAKWRLLVHQRSDQLAILSAELVGGLYRQKIETLAARLCVVSTDDVVHVMQQERFNKDIIIFDVCDRQLRRTAMQQGYIADQKIIFSIDALPATTFLANWLFIVAVLYERMDYFAIKNLLLSYGAQENGHLEHRLEWCGTVNGVDFYNDSKSTLPQATYAAALRLAQSGRPVLVILGGLSKGVDRSGLVAWLHSIASVRKVYSFGPGSFDLAIVDRCETLEEVMQLVFEHMRPGDQILFSPSGASFDLFKHYEHRGAVFKELVRHYIDSLHSQAEKSKGGLIY